MLTITLNTSSSGSLLAIEKILHFHSKQYARTPKKNSTVIKSDVLKQTLQLTLTLLRLAAFGEFRK